MRPSLIVHGGCGTPPPEEEGPRQEACERAADAGWELLGQGGTALDAVEAAVRRLEEEPLLNAGTGSYLQADGVARMDASIMASDGRAGAVLQVPGLRNPVRLARYVLDHDAHVMLSGREALELALRLGHPARVVATPSKIEYWRDHLTDACVQLDYPAMAERWKEENPRRLGTVGCVAIDAQSQLAAATSTGGLAQSYPGRVGDTPVIGAGTYATGAVAVSMTGVGERILVLLSAKRLCDLVADGRPAQEAAAMVMKELDAINGAAGLIAVDASGALLERRNTPFMPTARRSGA